MPSLTATLCEKLLTWPEPTQKLPYLSHAASQSFTYVVTGTVNSNLFLCICMGMLNLPISDN